MGYDAPSLSNGISTFRSNVLSSVSLLQNLKCSSEALPAAYKTGSLTPPSNANDWSYNFPFHIYLHGVQRNSLVITIYV